MLLLLEHLWNIFLARICIQILKKHFYLTFTDIKWTDGWQKYKIVVDLYHLSFSIHDLEL